MTTKTEFMALLEADACGWFFASQKALIECLLGDEEIYGFVSKTGEDRMHDECQWELWMLSDSGLLHLVADKPEQQLSWTRYPRGTFAHVQGFTYFHQSHVLSPVTPLQWVRRAEVEVALSSGESLKFKGSDWLKSHPDTAPTVDGAFGFFTRLG